MIIGQWLIVDRHEKARQISLNDLRSATLVGVRVAMMRFMPYRLDQDESLVRFADGASGWIQTSDIADAIWADQPSVHEIVRIYRAIWDEEWRWEHEYDEWGLAPLWVAA